MSLVTLRSDIYIYIYRLLSVNHHTQSLYETTGGSSIVGSEVLVDIICVQALQEAFKNHLRVSITTLTTNQDALLVGLVD
ncbi:hypothetical protein PNOK_0314700 [Pyrrhoderma noxium]|uniref:Uncharacterized protein n=1 Tax=Pyrrhoderma noxium TaxID=2282107 RepID=A0A286ULR3_9AGAM|nr:hypothetical protein PNOK_0314700 [Pyrrhoderma noxium]